MDHRTTHPSTSRHLRAVGENVPRAAPFATEQAAANPIEPTPSDTHVSDRKRSLLGSIVVATRPRQWVKNVLVFAAPMAAGDLGRVGVLGRSAAAAGLFLAASAGTYLVNDAIDAPHDRVHPAKRFRPIASGAVPVKLALVLGGVLLVVAVGGAAALAGAPLAAVLGAYALVTTAYSLWLKHIPVIELACVASGFVLRAVAGGAAVHIPISPWFAIVTSAAALLVVTGKRSTELAVLGNSGAAHRRVLDDYPVAFLRSVRIIGASVAVMSYALWAFDRAAHGDFGVSDADDLLLRLSVVPFVLGVLMVELAIEGGKGGAPEELVLRHRPVQVLGLTCIAFVVAGIYW
jgi:decaprenyl-phosphate phosphoribosyltransferase